MIATKRRTRSLASILLLAFVLGLGLHAPLIATAAAAAQDSSGNALSDSDIDFSKMKGIQYAVGRSYVGDMSKMIAAMTASPEAGQSPDLGLFGLSGIILQFDNKGHASDSFDDLTSQVTASMDESDPTMTMTTEKIDKIGDKSAAYSSQISDSGMAMSVYIVISQKGKYIVAGFGVAIGGDAGADTRDFTKAIVKAKGGDGLGDLKADGTSTGGLWTFFPATGDDVLKGLTPMSDSELYPKDTSGD